MKKNLVLSLIMVVSNIYAQKVETILYQNIRGKVIEAYTELPLPGATIIVLNNGDNKGTTADANGNFILEKVPIGRVSIAVSFVGYNNGVYNNLELLSSKELYLTIKLEEKAIEINEVKISAHNKKNDPLNELATVSARTFLVEETNKYAGSLGDPARMAGNFAGILMVDDSRNDIIIRGNSPYGLLWRVDGFDIPNPNHYSMPGSKGGAMSMLNNNNLSNSDFMTSAFPAEYGNALSGVFDLNLRNGNPQQYEHVFQLATSGFELGTEGPISRKKNSTYIANYRYSAPQVFDIIGLWDDPALPKYQDVTFKFNFPDTKIGNIQFFGLGGQNSIIQDSRKMDSLDWTYGLKGMVMNMNNYMGVLGFKHTVYFNSNTRIISKISVQYTDNNIVMDTVLNKNSIVRSSDIGSKEIKSNYESILKVKFNSGNYLDIGARYEWINTIYKYDYFPNDQSLPEYMVDVDDRTDAISAFSEYRHRFGNKLDLNTGIRYEYFVFNKSQSLEPRIGLKYKFTGSQTMNLGYGLHSQHQNNITYFLESYDSESQSYVRTNSNLDFTKSQHFVIGYNNMLTQHLNFKAEVYYQELRDVPVTHTLPQFSILNTGGAFDISVEDSLENKGSGQNYGIELTLEKYLNKNFYFLITGSLFESKYKGYDGKLRNTEFNGNYAFNVLFGYDIKLKKKNTLGFNIRGIYAGGKRELPIDFAASKIANETKYDWEHAYEKRFPDYYRIDLRISYKTSHKKYAEEMAVDIINVTDNTSNIINRYYDPTTNALTADNQSGAQYNFLYRIYF